MKGNKLINRMIYDKNPKISTLVNVGNKCIENGKYIIPQGITNIGHNAFEMCDDLVYIEIPSSVKVIEYSAFQGCKNLKFVKLNEGLEIIEQFAFSSCPRLSSIELPESVKYVQEDAFSFSGIKSFKTNSAVNFGPKVFQWCQKLQNVELHNGVITITESMFANCDRLKEIKLPSSVDTIREYSFASCSDLENVILMRDKKSLKLSIDIFAFIGSFNLKEIQCNKKKDIELVQHDELGRLTTANYDINEHKLGKIISQFVDLKK